jgi:hypothetical protein
MLHLFIDDDNNAYAATDLDHAKSIWTSDTGMDANDTEWQCVPDERSITVDDEGAKVTKTAGEWANETDTPGCRFGSDY